MSNSISIAIKVSHEFSLDTNLIPAVADESDNFERSVGVNFDWYSPKFAFRHTPKEVKTWFKESNLKITSFKEIESGISVTGQK